MIQMDKKIKENTEIILSEIYKYTLVIVPSNQIYQLLVVVM